MTYLNRKLINESLLALSDKEYQKRVWLASEGPEISSFIEDMCLLFDDSGLSLALKKGVAFGDEPDLLLRRLSSILQMINPHRKPAEIIDDPKMDDVRLTSSKILELIKQIQP